METAEGRVAELVEQLQAGQALGLGPGADGISTASHAELAATTGGFAAAHILGRGGFGPVYRGEWQGRAVAVKRLDADSLQAGMGRMATDGPPRLGNAGPWRSRRPFCAQEALSGTERNIGSTGY